MTPVGSATCTIWATTIYCGTNPVGVGVTVCGVEVGVGVIGVEVGDGVVCPAGWPRAVVVRVTEGVTDWTGCVTGEVTVIPLWEITLVDGGETRIMPICMSRIVELLAIRRNAKRRLTIAQKRLRRFCGFEKFSSVTPEVWGG